MSRFLSWLTLGMRGGSSSITTVAETLDFSTATYEEVSATHLASASLDFSTATYEG